MASKSKRISDQEIEKLRNVLERAGYRCALRVNVRSRLGYEKRYILDIVATGENDREFLIKLRWQSTGGTTEAKIPYDVICLAHARALNERADKAYLVLGGSGWSLKDYYIDEGLDRDLRNADLVEIVAIEEFTRLANAGAI